MTRLRVALENGPRTDARSLLPAIEQLQPKHGSTQCLCPHFVFDEFTSNICKDCPSELDSHGMAYSTAVPANIRND